MLVFGLQFIEWCITNSNLVWFNPTQGILDVLLVWEESKERIRYCVLWYSFFLEKGNQHLENCLFLFRGPFYWYVIMNQSAEVHKSILDNLLNWLMNELLLDKFQVLQWAHLLVHDQHPEVTPHCATSKCICQVKIFSKPINWLLVESDFAVSVLVMIDIDCP